MVCNVYCPICGAIMLDNRTRIHDPDSTLTPARPWYTEVRGIYKSSDRASITGLGIVGGRNRLDAPLDKNKSYLELRYNDLHHWWICESSETWPWCFAVHNSCWTLLLLRLDYQNNGLRDDEDITALVYSQLYDTPCLDGSVFQFGHDYGGAAQTHKTSGRISVDPGSHLYADPCAIPDVSELETASSMVSWPFPPHGNTMTQPCCINIFHTLSSELHFEVFAHLSFDELLSLRLVCRQFAVLANPGTLPQSYWRTRFDFGQEADFLFPQVNASTPRNWSALFFGTRLSLKTGNLSLANRKRIRLLLEPIAALVELESAIAPDTAGGFACRLIPETNDNCFEIIESQRPSHGGYVMKHSSFSGQINTTSADNPLREGCRVLHYRAQLWLPQFHTPYQRVGISTIQTGARNFIAGMNLFAHSVDVGDLIGYHIPTSEKWIEFSSSQKLKALNVTFCLEGLMGVKFVFGASSSDWIGDSSGPDISHGILEVPQGLTTRESLVVGLDRHKIVSLALGQVVEHAGVITESSFQEKPDEVQSRLWIPHAPAHQGVKITSLLSEEARRPFEPLLNIDFGGLNGSLLPSLMRLTIYMVSPPYPIAGIEIWHGDEMSTSFGSSSGCGLSFFIDGPGGERIDRIDAVYGSSQSLCGLQLSTNYRRVATLASLHLISTSTIQSIPFAGDIITGMVARAHIRLNRNHIRSVGIQSQDFDDQITISVPTITHTTCHEIPADQLQYDLNNFSHFIKYTNPGNYHTYASLRNIRKIQASRGIPGRSRSPDHISGLKIDYYDHPSPGVVGQWMDGHDGGGGFELSRGEDIQLLAVSLTPVGFSTARTGIELGLVCAIRFETTWSRSITFCPGLETSSLPPHSVRTLQLQYQADNRTGEKLTAMSWILNEESERVRAVLSPDQGSQIKDMVYVPEAVGIFDDVLRIYFESCPQGDIDHPHGSGNAVQHPEPVAAAEAYFRDYAIIGLVFIYRDGTRSGIGYFDSSSSLSPSSAEKQILQFPTAARIVGLSAKTCYSGKSEVIQLDFEFEHQSAIGNDNANFAKLTFSAPAPNNGAIPPIAHVRRVFQWCRDEETAELAKTQRLHSSDRVYAPPSHTARLVGLYVGCQDFSKIGVLYSMA
ncbi:hypothetical protein BJX99DRAFT_272534 [Aspergillus californicus]